ncbi:hypothetical protein C8R44DRAFT_754955 [Mycena epipterygia]|nr:hypothetical protein C8R44DRAFT_754955 [Mycena epipterygia]
MSILLDAEENGLPNLKDIGAADRAEKLRKRIGNPSPLQQITNVVNVGPSAQASELEAIRAAKIGANGNFTVQMCFRRKGTVDKEFGTHTFVMPLDLPLDDVEWLKDQANPISLKTLSPLVPHQRLLNLRIVVCVSRTTLLLRKKPSRCHSKYKARVERLKRLVVVQDDSDSLVSLGRKRKGTASNDVPEKRIRTGNGTLYSSVRLTNNLSALGYNAQAPAPATVNIVSKKLRK